MSGDTETQAEVDNDDAFNAGFEDDGQTTTPEQDFDKPEEKPADDVPAEVEAAPKYAQITEEQYADLLAKADSIEQIKADAKRQFDNAFGQLGGMKQVLEKFQTATPAGQTVEVTDEDFSELSAEFPELAASTIKGITKVLSKMKGTGPVLDETLIEQIVEKRVSGQIAELREDALDRLQDIVPGWNKGDKLKDIQTWAQQQPDDVKQLAVSDRPRDAAELLRKYRDRPKPVAPVPAKPAAPTTRQRQLEAAVTPKSAGGHQPARAGVDPFDEGFNEG